MDTTQWMDVARSAAREAGDVLVAQLDQERTIEHKGEIDLVTDMDHWAESLILERLRAACPDHDIVSEESEIEMIGSAFRWIIDPLDGTTNYAHRFPVFCVSIGLQHEGQMLLGCVYDPTRQELFSAVRGGGAFLNDVPIHTSTATSLNTSLLATGFPYDRRDHADAYLDLFKAFMVRTQAIRRCGAAALDLCYVACGRVDGFWELKLQPWDIAAGSIIIEEAGGQISNFSGEPVQLSDLQIAASNGRLHQELIEVLERHWPGEQSSTVTN